MRKKSINLTIHLNPLQILPLPLVLFYLLLMSIGLAASILFPSHALATNRNYHNYCEEYGLGWNFYCQEVKQKEGQEERGQQKQKEEGKAKIPQNQEDAAQKLAQIKQTLEDKKVKAVIYPNEENIKDYLVYQQMVLNKSSTFADQWRRVLWQSPELDYTLKRPVSKIGKESWIDQRNQNISQAVKNINERYGIFFLFSGSCPHCHRYSPILKNFQEKYGITIMPVSMDGGFLPEWPRSLTNHGQIEKMGIESSTVPATILFDKKTKKVIPVGYGVLAHSELEERIYTQTKLEVGDDF